MTTFKKWLSAQIDYLRGSHDYGSQDDIIGMMEEARQRAIDCGLPEAAEILRHKGPPLVRLLEALRAIPEPKIGPTDSMSVKQVAERLGVSKETIYGLCADGTMPHTRVARRITITPEQLAEHQRQAVR